MMGTCGPRETETAVHTASTLTSASHDATGRIRLPQGQSVLMLGTDPRTRGGIAAVIETLRTGGLFDRVPVTLIATHQDGSWSTKGLRFTCATARVVWLLICRKAALAHAHVSSRASFWRKSALLLLIRAFGVPTIFHLHSGGFATWASQSGPSAALRRWWVRRTLEASNAVVVLTPSWATWVRDFAPLSKVSIVGNPVQVPGQEPSTATRSSGRDNGRVLYLGWIYDFKGVYDLLEAWSQFRHFYPGWRLVIGGKGEVDKFLEVATRLGVREDLDFLGWVTGNDKNRALRSADIFVLPSYSEGMPVSILEAMAFGASVIATPVGGVPDMMQPDVHGLWVNPGDIQGLVDRMSRLAASPELRKRLALAGYEHVLTNYSVMHSNNLLIKLYCKLAIRG